MSYDYLTEFANASQLDKLAALSMHGSMRAAAKAMGIDHSNFCKTIKALKKKAALRGVSPEHDWTKAVPPTHIAKGVSSYYNKDGVLAGQWVKADIDCDQREAILKECATALAESVKGLAKPVKAPAKALDKLMAVYPWGDPHFGLLCWAQEAGDDFDLGYADRLTKAAVDRLVATAPAAETAVLLNLGDMFHADNQKNQSQSGHQLDVDGRWAKILRVGLEAKIHCIRRMLEKHKRVIVRINRGNHDGHSSYSLSLMLSCYFSNEPRVEVDLSPSTLWYMEFGNVLIGSTHGDTIKGKDAIAVMAADKPEAWGRTKHRHMLVGHVHHHDSKEYPGGIVEYFRTLAARDAWHTNQGYRAGRDMRCIVFHHTHGEIERHRADIGMLTEE
jgi:hypothetical protein